MTSNTAPDPRLVSAASATAMPRLFCAIDTADRAQARQWITAIAAAGAGIKLGMEFFNAHGPQGIKDVMADITAPLFLDLKWHDIPNTVAGAVRAACLHHAATPAYINVHAAGGRAMMTAAAEAARTAHDNPAARPKVLAVTILTSLDDAALAEAGYKDGAAQSVITLARLAQDSGMDGIVCAAHEIAAIRAACGPDFILMVPGIRPAGADAGDQKRIMTPEAAIAAGAHHIVMGRPITAAPDPEAAARAIITAIT